MESSLEILENRKQKIATKTRSHEEFIRKKALLGNQPSRVLLVKKVIGEFQTQKTFEKPFVSSCLGGKYFHFSIWECPSLECLIMKIHYDSKTDLLYLRFDERKQNVTSNEVAEGIVFDVGATGKLVGIEILDASEHVDLEKLLPVEIESSQ